MHVNTSVTLEIRFDVRNFVRARAGVSVPEFTDKHLGRHPKVGENVAFSLTTQDLMHLRLSPDRASQTLLTMSQFCPKTDWTKVKGGIFHRKCYRFLIIGEGEKVIFKGTEEEVRHTNPPEIWLPHVIVQVRKKCGGWGFCKKDPRQEMTPPPEFQKLVA